jgi:hypothetical protein
MDHSGHSTIPGPHGGPGYETRDANTRGILIFAILLTAFVILTLISMTWVYDWFVAEAEPKTSRPSNIQVSVYKDLAETRKSATDTLTTYGWVDRKAGVVRIPIQRAIEVALKRGLPKGKGPKTELEVITRGVSPQTEADLKKLEKNEKK